MTWEDLSTIAVSNTWQLSQASSSELFRLKQESPLGFYGQGLIAQASTATGGLDLFEPQKFYLTFPEVQIFKLVKPDCFTTRRIAIRGTYYKFPIGWTIKLQHWTAMPLSNPPAFPKPSTSAATSVAASATSVSLLAANAARVGFSVWNSSNAILYLDYGATATASAYAVRIDPGGYFESPVAYTGAVSAIWSAANGSALVREFS